MSYHNVEFLISANNKNSWPNHELKEILFVGRSNVGKSSLINKLVERKNLAYAASTPGKTKLLNFFKIDEKYVFVDAPGYGFAVGSKNTFIDFSKLMDDYLENRENLSLIIMIVDLRHKPTSDDIDMINYLRSSHKKIVVIANKKDKVKNKDLFKNIKTIKEVLNIRDVILCSTVLNQGYDLIWDEIKALY